MADLEGERARKDSDTFAKSMDKGIEAGHSSVCGCGTVGDTSPPNAKGACSVSQSPPLHWKIIGRDGETALVGFLVYVVHPDILLPSG